MTKRNRKIKNIFIKLQLGIYIMVNIRHQYKTILKKCVVWKFDILDYSLVVFRVLGGKNRNKPLWSNRSAERGTMWWIRGAFWIGEVLSGYNMENMTVDKCVWKVSRSCTCMLKRILYISKTSRRNLIATKD
jgi:hypothetical protein